MSIYSTPSPYLSRLQDLKLWQGNYDALLQCKATDTSNLSDYDTIDLSGIDSTKSSLTTPQKSKNAIDQSIDWDQKTILQMKPFEQLLEEKLAEDQPVVVHSKPKKPYLKKGTGLLRYKSVNKPRIPRCSKHSRSTYHSDAAIQNELLKGTMSPSHKNESSMKNSRSVIDITPLTMPEGSIKPKATWCQVGLNLNVSKSPRGNGGAKKKPVLNTISEYSYQKLIPISPRKNGCDVDSIKRTVEQRNDIPKTRSFFESSEDGELKIFEALEERVEHPSFSPNNTSIIRLLSSTPTKARQKLFGSPRKTASLKPHAELSPTNEVQTSPKRYSDSGQQCDGLGKKVEGLQINDVVLTNFLDNLKKFVENEKIEDAKKEMLEERTNTSTSGKWSTDTEDHSPTSSFYTDFENTLRSKAHVCVNAAVNTSFEEVREEGPATSVECKNCKELSRKLEMLQKQIPDVQAEKARVCDFAKELEKKRDQLYREIERLKRKYDADVQDLRKELAQEKRTFAKEKAIFEMYIKDCQNRPTKKEREEISNLKKELIDLKELMKLKDTKNGAMAARLRSQVKQLEKEREELKNSVEALQKENAKLNASRKVTRPVEVKMLQEINKNLTKLAEETLKKQHCSPDVADTDEKSPGSSSRSTTGNNEGTQVTSCPKKSSFRTSIKRSQNTLVNDIRSYKEDHSGFSNADVEKHYETVFGQFEGDANSPSSFNSSKRDRVESTFPDGSKEIKYGNGNVKSISPDGKLIIVQYYNGDIKETNKSDNTLKYYYAENSTWHTQFADGSELIEYSNGQKEKKYSDGKREITCPDGVFLTKLPDGTEEISYPDGSKLIKKCNRERILMLPNGQKEFHTTEHMRREYPDGTVKIVYPNGTQETRYATGRVRIKDESGILIMDSEDG